MSGKNYDLYRCVQGQALWLETIADFDRAIDRMNSLASNEPSEYYVLDQETFRIVAATEQRPETSAALDSNRRTSGMLTETRRA